MSKVTSKFQVTLPQAIARAHGIKPGSDIHFESAGDTIRIRIERPGFDLERKPDFQERLKWFDRASERQAKRNAKVLERLRRKGTSRGWSREELYKERLRH